jgi:hypothetical protein
MATILSAIIIALPLGLIASELKRYNDWKK